MFKNIQCQISTTRDWYYTFNKKIHLLTNIQIKNTQLAKELELACVKYQGILTYAEYLTIEQFGKYGYYATHITHGQTDVDTRWGTALARYCIENNFRTIIEFGCGTGELGAAI